MEQMAIEQTKQHRYIEYPKSERASAAIKLLDRQRVKRTPDHNLVFGILERSIDDLAWYPGRRDLNKSDYFDAVWYLTSSRFHLAAHICGLDPDFIGYVLRKLELIPECKSSVQKNKSISA